MTKTPHPTACAQYLLLERECGADDQERCQRHQEVLVTWEQLPLASSHHDSAVSAQGWCERTLRALTLPKCHLKTLSPMAQSWPGLFHEKLESGNEMAYGRPSQWALGVDGSRATWGSPHLGVTTLGFGHNMIRCLIFLWRQLP